MAAHPGKRPFIFVNVATTLDGKLAPANRRFVPFSSLRDQELLMKLRTKADAVMAGARTVDLGKVDLAPGGSKWRKMRLKNGLSEYNIRVVVSGSGTLNPNAHIFSVRHSPILVLTTGRASARNLARLRRVADAVEIFGEEALDFKAALGWLWERWGVRRLLCEGGGEVNAGLFEAGLVDEIYITLSPLVLCGRGAPTLADGRGILSAQAAPRFRLKSLRRVGDELFLVYRARRRSDARK